MPHYGLQWRSHSAFPGAPALHLSGHQGIRFFTQGSEVVTILPSGDTRIRSFMKADNLFTHYHNMGIINYAGNIDISTSSGFLRGSTDTVGALGSGWYLWSIHRSDGNPFERAFGYFYKYIQGASESASGSVQLYVLNASGVTATGSGNNFRVITSSNSVSFPSGYAIRIIRLGLRFAGG